MEDTGTEETMENSGTCVVSGCPSKGGSKSKSLFRFPAIITHQGEQTLELSTRRRAAWIAAVNRLEEPTQFSRICSDHFVQGRPAGLYQRDDPDWIPSLLLTKDKRETHRNASGKGDNERKVRGAAGRHCYVIGCHNGDTRLHKWKNEPCSQHGVLFDSPGCDCPPPFELFTFPTKKMDLAGRERWKRKLRRADPKNPGVLLEPTVSHRVCSRHFVHGRPTKQYPDPELDLGYNRATGRSWSFRTFVSKERMEREQAKRRRSEKNKATVDHNYTDRCKNRVATQKILLENADFKDEAPRGPPESHEYCIPLIGDFRRPLPEPFSIDMMKATLTDQDESVNDSDFESEEQIDQESENAAPVIENLIPTTQSLKLRLPSFLLRTLSSFPMKSSRDYLMQFHNGERSKVAIQKKERFYDIFIEDITQIVTKEDDGCLKCELTSLLMEETAFDRFRNGNSADQAVQERQYKAKNLDQRIFVSPLELSSVERREVTTQSSRAPVGSHKKKLRIDSNAAAGKSGTRTEVKKVLLFEDTRFFEQKQNQTSDNQTDTSDNQKQISDNQKDTSDNQKQISDNQKQTSDNQKETSDNQKETSDNQTQTSDNQTPTSDNQTQTSDNQKQTSDNSENETFIILVNEDSDLSDKPNQSSDNAKQGFHTVISVSPLSTRKRLKSSGCDRRSGVKRSRPGAKKRKYSCVICSKAFKNISILKEHMVTHSVKREHVCDTCGKGFKHENTLHRHMSTVHKRVYRYTCETCGHGVEKKHMLLTHKCGRRKRKAIVVDVNEIPPPSAESNETGSGVAQGLTGSGVAQGLTGSGVAQRLTSGRWEEAVKQKKEDPDRIVIKTRDGRFCCAVCRKLFRSSTTLVRHEKTAHSLGSPAVVPPSMLCPICGKDQKYTSLYEQHMAMHRGERKHVCSECGVKLTSASILKNHIKVVHRGEYRYRCEICSHGFQRKSNLIKHKCGLIRNHMTKTLRDGSVVSYKREDGYKCNLVGKTLIRPSEDNDKEPQRIPYSATQQDSHVTVDRDLIGENKSAENTEVKGQQKMVNVPNPDGVPNSTELKLLSMLENESNFTFYAVSDNASSSEQTDNRFCLEGADYEMQVQDESDEANKDDFSDDKSNHFFITDSTNNQILYCAIADT